MCQEEGSRIGGDIRIMRDADGVISVPEEDDQGQEERDLTLIDAETFWDLLMEQQEQM